MHRCTKQTTLLAFILFLCGHLTCNAATFKHKDGSILHGEVISGTIEIETPSGNNIIDFKNIFHIAKYKIMLSDGTTLEGKIKSGAVKAQTSIGIISIPVEKIDEFTYDTPTKSGTAQQQNDEFDKTLQQVSELSRQGQYEQALTLAKTAQQQAQDTKSQYWYAAALMATGTVYLTAQEYEEASQAATLATEITKVLMDNNAISDHSAAQMNRNCFKIIIASNTSLGRLAIAAEFAGKWVNIEKNKTDSAKILLEAFTVAADTCRATADYELAAAHCNNGLEIASKNNDKNNMAIFLNMLGTIAFYQGRLQEAMERFTKEESLRKSMGENTGLTVKKNANGTSMATGNLFSAAMFRAAIKSDKDMIEYYNLLEKAGQFSSIFNSTVLWASRGYLYEKNGKIKEAIADYEQAIESMEKLRSNARDPERRIDFFHQYAKIYHHLAHLLYVEHKTEASMRISQQAKAKVLLELLETKNTDYGKDIPSILRQQEQEANQDVDYAYTRYIQQKNSSEPNAEKRSAQAAQDLAQKEAALKDFQERVRKSNPEYANLRFPAPIDLKTIQKDILDDKSAIIEYSVGEKQTLIYCITKDNIYTAEANITEKDLETMIVQFRSPFIDPSITYNIAEHIKTGNEIYRQLIEPVISHCRGKQHLTIIPDGLLYYLPFNALVVKPGTDYNTTSFLVNEYAISLAPSTKILHWLKQHKPHHKKNKVVAFGDPSYSDKFTRLNSTADEVRTIESIFMPDTKIYLGKDANKENVKNNISDATIIHFATHGYLDEQKPMYSSIILSPDKNNPSQDSFLYAYEVFGLKLNADLVTLAACETGLGKLEKGEGIISLARAFLYAGSSSVMVSLWSVDDKSTSLIMSKFYSLLKQNNINKEEALRQAQLIMLTTPAETESQIPTRGIKVTQKGEITYCHPYFWAPFTLIGD